MPPTSSACRLVSLSFCLLVFCVRYFLLFHQLAHDGDLMIFLQTSLFLVCPYAEDRPNCVPLSPKSSLTLSIILFLCLSLLLSPLTGILLWSRTGRCGMKICPAWSAVRKTSNINIDVWNKCCNWFS